MTKNMTHKSYNPFQLVGEFTISQVRKLGKVSIFTYQAIIAIVTPPYHLKMLLLQFYRIGFLSLPVIALTALFTGAVLALQSYTGFSRFNAESSIATVVVLSITRELGPVLAGLMVAGRVGASIAAELGSMRVTEQIDALKTLNTDPMKYLIAPRIIAAIVSMPILVLIADILGVMGGYFVSVHKLGFNASSYLISTFEYLELGDVYSGLIKACVFGFLISLMGCYHGFHTKNGAQGVGLSTTLSVVSGSILVLFSNFFLTQFLFTA